MKAVEIQDRRGKLRTLMKVELTRFDNALDTWNEKKRGTKDKSPIFGLRLCFYKSGEEPRFK